VSVAGRIRNDHARGVVMLDRKARRIRRGTAIIPAGE